MFFIRYFRKLWRWIQSKYDVPNKPRALPMRIFSDDSPDEYCWEDWHKEAKAKYPIRHFIFHELSIWVSVKYRIYVEDPIWWFKSYLIRKDHLLDLRNSPSDDYKGVYDWGYCDPQHVLEHAVYKSFMLYIKELDRLSDWSDKSCNIKHEKYVGHGIDRRLEWLQEEYDNTSGNDRAMYASELERCKHIKELFIFFNKELPELYRQSREMLSTDGMNKEERLEFYDKRRKFDDFIEDTLEEKMIEIIKIRKTMWT